MEETKMKKLLSLITIFILCLTLYGCCLECDGDGWILCSNPECSVGEVPCKTCSGKGGLGDICSYCSSFGYNSYDCTWCNGSGDNGWPGEYNAKCYNCNGWGYKKEQCRFCDGIGYTGGDCPDCYGGEVDCPQCGGDMKIDCPSCSKKQH